MPLLRPMMRLPKHCAFSDERYFFDARRRALCDCVERYDCGGTTGAGE